MCHFIEGIWVVKIFLLFQGKHIGTNPSHILWPRGSLVLDGVYISLPLTELFLWVRVVFVVVVVVVVVMCMCAKVPEEAIRKIQIPWSWTSGNWSIPGCWELNSGTLEEQQVFSITEPFLWSQTHDPSVSASLVYPTGWHQHSRHECSCLWGSGLFR